MMTLCYAGGDLSGKPVPPFTAGTKAACVASCFSFALQDEQGTVL
jgi:hypothetical protein